MNRDTPTIASSAYAMTHVPLAAFGGVGNADAGWVGKLDRHAERRVGADHKLAALQMFQDTSTTKQENAPMAATRRLVKVVIVDPNENIPLDQCLLYSGEEQLTDATDQELFFEIDIKDILTKHNEKRVKVADKKVKERVEYLEPAKIRDLKMVVVNVASF